MNENPIPNDNLALTDVDVREAEEPEHKGEIEVATFCRGAYVESVYIDRERATELRDQLDHLLLGPAPDPVKAVRDGYSVSEDECPGHNWQYTGTMYGGEDDSYHGEGRAYCSNCGADGDA